MGAHCTTRPPRRDPGAHRNAIRGRAKAARFSPITRRLSLGGRTEAPAFSFSLSRGICAVCGRGHPNAAWPDGGRTPAQTTQKQIESLLSRQQTPPRLPCAKNWRRKHALIIPRDAMQRGRRDFTEAIEVAFTARPLCLTEERNFSRLIPRQCW